MDEKYKKCDENKHDRLNMYFPFNQSYNPTLLFIPGYEDSWCLMHNRLCSALSALDRNRPI